MTRIIIGYYRSVRRCWRLYSWFVYVLAPLLELICSVSCIPSSQIIWSTICSSAIISRIILRDDSRFFNLVNYLEMISEDEWIIFGKRSSENEVPKYHFLRWFLLLWIIEIYLINNSKNYVLYNSKPAIIRAQSLIHVRKILLTGNKSSFAQQNIPNFCI